MKFSLLALVGISNTISINQRLRQTPTTGTAADTTTGTAADTTTYVAGASPVDTTTAYTGTPTGCYPDYCFTQAGKEAPEC
jgi:hypothetical protein